MVTRARATTDVLATTPLLGSRRLLTGVIAGAALTGLSLGESSEAKRKGKSRKGKTRKQQKLTAQKKQGGGGSGAVVIETGPTVVLEGPYDPNNDPVVEITSTATCSNGVAIGGGAKTVRPTQRVSVILQDSYPSSATEWTVTALTQETGQGFTPYVLCLV